MISVCMATYNGERFLKEQLDSILVQLSEQDEIVIVDDASTDSTIEIIKSYNDNRINLYCNERNMGVNYTFNKTLSLANGDYIFLSDQDDIWHIDKVKIVKKYLFDYELVEHNAMCFRDIDRSRVDVGYFFSIRNAGPGLLKNFIKNTYNGCFMAFHRYILDEILPIPSKIDMYDVWIGLVCELNRRRIIFIKDILVEFRRHDYNKTNVFRRRNLCEIIKSRLIMAYYLLFYTLKLKLKMIG